MMSLYLIYILIILFGLAVGSFLNVIILRFDDLRTIWKTRSHCVKCKKEIRWFDLVPFFSYIALRGRCRDCQKPISYQYPIVEVLTAVVFACVYYHYGISWSALLLVIILSLLIVIAVYDIIHMAIPDILTYLGIFFSIGFVFLTLTENSMLSLENLIPHGYAILVGGGFLGALVIFSREKWMGSGDILMGIMMGVLLGMPNVLIGLFAAFVLGSMVGIILIAGHKKTLKDAVPFGPFLVLGTLIALFWGNSIIELYWGIF